jgi:hypothetical protein
MEKYYIAQAEINNLTKEVLVGYVTTRTASFHFGADLSLLTVGRILTDAELEALKEFALVTLV